ncbi:MAG TPA: hypothetical protein VMS40_09570 [Vicinamibacterales bacterium]|nr:hypothetical protein [Vicinamibacterales bacterium]
MKAFLVRVLVTVAICFSWTSAFAQWLKYPTAGIPRTGNGKFNPSAPTPRTADGKPDFSGIWLTEAPNCPNSNSESLVCGVELPMSPQGINMGIGIPGGLPYQPWLAALVKERTANNAKDDPHVRCLPDTFVRAYGLPHLLKFVQTPGLLVMLNEMNAGYRQVFLDGRPLPADPTPSWQGYSSAMWSGDTLVVNSNGFRDDIWIDWNGSMITEAAKVRERIRRPDFGHLEVEVTIDDPKAYTKPWTVTVKQRLIPDNELMEFICNENEKSSAHFVK